MSGRYDSIPEAGNPARSKNKQYLLGFFVLLLVDVLWVASAELTEFIFNNQKFDKPFFTTYSKTFLFMTFLFGFVFYRPWQVQCGLCMMNSGGSRRSRHKPVKQYNGKIYQGKINSTEESDSDETARFNRSLTFNSNFSSRSSSPGPGQFLTDPVFENMTDDDTSTIASDLDIGDRNHRRVTFNKIREIRSMPEKGGNEALFARMSHSKFEDVQKVLSHINSRVPLVDTIRLAFVFSVLWMCGSLFYQEALAHTSAAVTNILSSTSGFFTLILSALFQSTVKDKFTLSKFLAVSASIGGISLVSLSDPHHHQGRVNYGAVFALFSALFYAIYLVMLTRKVGDQLKLDIPLFFGFVGLFSGLMFWPVFFILHYTGLEKFSFPPDNDTWMYIAVNGFVGTVLAELLWLWGCFLTSSLVGTLALGLVTPMTMAWDMAFNKLKFSWMFIGGTVPVFVSFFAVALFSHYGDWDPVMDGIKWIFTMLFSLCSKT
eukprot:gene17617-19371_t